MSGDAPKRLVGYLVFGAGILLALITTLVRFIPLKSESRVVDVDEEDYALSVVEEVSRTYLQFPAWITLVGLLLGWGGYLLTRSPKVK